MNKMQIVAESGSILLFDVYLALTEKDSVIPSGRCVFEVKNCIGKVHSYRVVLLHRDEIFSEKSSWNHCVAVTPDSVLMTDQPLSVVEGMLLFEAMYRMRQNALEGTKYVRDCVHPLRNLEIRLSETKGCTYLCNLDQEVISEEITDE